MKGKLWMLCILLLLQQTTQANFVPKESQTIVYQQDKTIAAWSAEPQGRIQKKKKKHKAPQSDEEYERLRKQRRMWYALGFSLGMGLCLLFLPMPSIFLIASAFGSFFPLYLGIFLVIGLLALAFWIVAFWRGRQLYKKMQAIKKNGTTNNNNNPQPQIVEKQDVVYFKNGTILKGKVLQIIPNDSIKIEIAGGSILVYKMEEVERISKEE